MFFFICKINTIIQTCWRQNNVTSTSNNSKSLTSFCRIWIIFKWVKIQLNNLAGKVLMCVCSGPGHMNTLAKNCSRPCLVYESYTDRPPLGNTMVSFGYQSGRMHSIRCHKEIPRRNAIVCVCYWRFSLRKQWKQSIRETDFVKGFFCPYIYSYNNSLIYIYWQQLTNIIVLRSLLFKFQHYLYISDCIVLFHLEKYPFYFLQIIAFLSALGCHTMSMCTKAIYYVSLLYHNA